MLSALAACLMSMADAIPPELDAYLARPDPSFAWAKKEPGLGSLHLRMTSQTWRNVRWTHDIVLVDEGSAKGDAAILYVTGGEPNKADLDEASRLSKLAKMPVGMLFQIPNQPIFGMKEDDLIAHTFEQYLKTGDAEWPLLFPMVKSAKRAMDVLEKEKGLKRFVVTGASKRGWTAWLAGAIQDKRVIGIAPMVFDNLRLKEQLAHQLELWGKYSEMLGDYTERGLDKIVDTPPGKKLVALVDPWTYRSRLTMPKLIVNGSNDRYWATDALSLYWDGLPEPKFLSIVPNAGHVLGDMSQALSAIAGFARSCVGEFAITPHQGRVVRQRNGSAYVLSAREPETRLVVQGGETAPQTDAKETFVSLVGIFASSAETGDLRNAHWELRQGLVLGGGNRISTSVALEPVAGKTQAFFGAVKHRFKDLEFILSTPPVVVK
jgi:PhoPQ-activated pathogenicity-related protein